MIGNPMIMTLVDTIDMRFEVNLAIEFLQSFTDTPQEFVNDESVKKNSLWDARPEEVLCY